MRHFTFSIFCISLAFLVASPVHSGAEEEKQSAAKTVSHYTGLVERVDIVADTGHTSILFHVDSGNILLDTFRIHFNKDSGNATHAWWMTKGGNDIELPPNGLQLKSIPKQGSKVGIEFNAPVPAKSSWIGVVRIQAIKSLDSTSRPHPTK